MKKILLEVGWQEKAIQVCESVAQKIDLAQFYDFKLFVTDEKGNMRVIEDEQLLLNSLPSDCADIWVGSTSFWEKMVASIRTPFD